MINSIVDQYQILEQLGGGGMGQVYRALDLELDREVAIKCVRPELANLEEVTKRFRAEARTLAKLSHHNIATVYRFFGHEGQLFLVMELIQGRPFGNMLREDGAQSPQQVVSMIQQALTGLGYAHEHKVVHRDIKPGNLMLAGSDVVKVLDFGIAHLLDGGTRLTKVGSVVGTPAYMAPEQVLGRAVDPRTDLYSLGIVLYEMLTGELPFAANSDFEVMRAQIEQEPRPLSKLSPSIPVALQSTIDRALAKDMSHRFQSAAQFADSLHASVEVPGVNYAPPIAGARAQNHSQSSLETHVVTAAGVNAASDTTVILPSADPGQQTSKQVQPGAKLYAIAGAGVLSLGVAAWLLFGGEAEQALSPIESQQPAVTALAVEAAAPREAPDQADTAPVANIPGMNNANDTPTSPFANLDTDLTAGAITHEPATSGPSGPGSTPGTTPAMAPTSTVNGSTSTAKPISKPAAKPKPKPAPQYSVRAQKVSVHKTQKRGRFSRAAGYGGSFVLEGPMGNDSAIVIDEYIEVRENGVRVLRQQVGSETVKRGRFSRKNRVQELKLLPAGHYDIRLVFENAGKRLGAYDWKLEVRE